MLSWRILPWLSSSSLWWLQAVFGLLWLIADYCNNWPSSPMCLHIISFPACLCLCPNFPFQYVHQSYWIRTHSTDLILTWLPLQRPYFQIGSHSQLRGIRISTYHFEGSEDIIKPITISHNQVRFFIWNTLKLQILPLLGTVLAPQHHGISPACCFHLSALLISELVEDFAR